ncbi:hypothetical protein [Flavobacterium terrigena]|uniref:Uncharacterized protein n=1 Tax=Flavobacterium terrigena TaxID=402734 RepID=A0A1H6W3P3_9FLAO|nr:hypothetical protein [Flavobacterium terrigena]SEJ09884.1 hypothetical protein SAMN05660918_2361 [Flavobacterium terrigena]
MKESLELPITLRAPNIDEVPANSTVSKRLEERKTANIVEGYILHQKDNNPDHADLGFNFYTEININNSNLWNLIVSLSKEMPEIIAIIFGHEGSELKYGKYSSKEKTLSFLNKYSKEIVADTFIEIGLLFQSENELIEIFVSESKYIKFWGINEESFTQIMNNFNLKQIDDIEFVDEYPKVREPLRLFDETAVETNDLIKMFEKEFI